MWRKQGGPGVGDHMCECVEGRGQREVREGSMRDVIRKRNSGSLGIPNCSCNLWGRILLLNGTLPIKRRSGIDQKVCCPRQKGNFCP